jgi:hypothetical protein
MGTKAFDVAASCRPLDDRELEGLGAVQDDSGNLDFTGWLPVKGIAQSTPCLR